MALCFFPPVTSSTRYDLLSSDFTRLLRPNVHNMSTWGVGDDHDSDEVRTLKEQIRVKGNSRSSGPRSTSSIFFRCNQCYFTWRSIEEGGRAEGGQGFHE